VSQRSKTHGRLRAEDREQNGAPGDHAHDRPDVETFDSLIEMVLDDNPFGCVDDTIRDGQTIEGVIWNREHYTAKVNFVNDDGKRVGTVSLQSPTIAAFEANAAEVMGNAALATAMLQ